MRFIFQNPKGLNDGQTLLVNYQQSEMDAVLSSPTQSEEPRIIANFLSPGNPMQLERYAPPKVLTDPYLLVDKFLINYN